MSSRQQVNVSGGGITFTGFLAILFIGLKLLHLINWSWVWVLAPIWIPFVLLLIIFIGIFTLGRL